MLHFRDGGQQAQRRGYGPREEVVIEKKYVVILVLAMGLVFGGVEYINRAQHEETMRRFRLIEESRKPNSKKDPGDVK